MTFKKLISAAAAVCAAASLSGQTAQLDIDLKKVGAPIQETMYGIFFEDINFAADGGLYAEMLMNRSFEYPNDRLQGWRAFGKVEVRSDGPFERNPHYVRLSDPGHAHKHTGLANNGWFGLGVKAGGQYRFSFWARSDKKVSLRVELFDQASMGEQQQFCSEKISVDSREWTRYQLILTSPLTMQKAGLRLFMETRDAYVDLEHVSLFPTDTYNGHENGMRKDLAEALADLKPGIFRVPGAA